MLVKTRRGVRVLRRVLALPTQAVTNQLRAKDKELTAAQTKLAWAAQVSMPVQLHWVEAHVFTMHAAIAQGRMWHHWLAPTLRQLHECA